MPLISFLRRLRVATFLVCAAVVSLFPTGCSVSHSDQKAPVFVAEFLDNGYHYIHNYPTRPCYSVDVYGDGWDLWDSNADRVQWKKGDLALSIYFSDNRRAAYAVQGMNPERVLRSFLAYELEYVRPRFEYYIPHAPSFSNEGDGTWMSWGWEARGGRRVGVRNITPTDQRHTIMTLWADPYALSFDFATSNMERDMSPDSQMYSVIGSLRFHPTCFRELEPGSTYVAGVQTSPQESEQKGRVYVGAGPASSRHAVQGRSGAAHDSYLGSSVTRGQRGEMTVETPAIAPPAIETPTVVIEEAPREVEVLPVVPAPLPEPEPLPMATIISEPIEPNPSSSVTEILETVEPDFVEYDYGRGPTDGSRYDHGSGKTVESSIEIIETETIIEPVERVDERIYLPSPVIEIETIETEPVSPSGISSSGDVEADDESSTGTSAIEKVRRSTAIVPSSASRPQVPRRPYGHP